MVDNLGEATDATAINFLQYKKHDWGHGSRRGDVMLVTGRFGLKSYSLAKPAHPRLLDEVTAEDLRLPGDPPVNFEPNANGVVSTFWQNEDMDVDRRRKLALLSRDPRAYAGSVTREPGEDDPNGATNIAGVYVIDARDPRDLAILSFQQLPTGHTTTCVNECRSLWTGGPAATDRQKAELGWTFGRPIIVTDLSNPRKPQAFPMEPVDLFRRDGVTAYSHDVQVDAAGIAWVSGDGGTRGYWTSGRHYDPVEGRLRRATALKPVPYGGGGIPEAVTADDTGGFEHNAWRPVGRDAPKGDPRYRRGKLLLSTEEDFGPPELACSDRGKFAISSLEGSFDGEAWRSTPAAPFRLETVGTWAPYQQEGSRPVGGPYDPLANFCSAHYFDVDASHSDLRVVRRGHEVPRHLGSREPDAVRLLAPRRRDRLGLLHAPRLRLHRRSHSRRGRPAADGRRKGGAGRGTGGRRSRPLGAPAAVPDAARRAVQGGPRHGGPLPASGLRASD